MNKYFEDGEIVKLPNYFVNQYGRVEVLPNTPPILVMLGTDYTFVRLPDPGAELILVHTSDLVRKPVHNCADCKCKYPSSNATVTVNSDLSNGAIVDQFGKRKYSESITPEPKLLNPASWLDDTELDPLSVNKHRIPDPM